MSDDARVLRFPVPDDGDDHALARQIVAMYAATDAPAPGAAARCAAAVLTGAAATREASRRWWWSAAAAVLVLGAGIATWRSSGVRAANDARSVAAAETRSLLTPIAGGAEMRFDLQLAAKARMVTIVGDFNGWDEKATPMMARSTDGSWSAEVPLAPGRHVYAFVVDGKRWLVDPLAPQVPDAGFGPANAVVVEGAEQ